jgi:L-threonylcarbamoyladenylate synthase
MKIIKLKYIDNKILKEVAETIINGGVVVHSTDTCYGIAADIHNEKAVQRAYDIKKRDYNKPVNIIVKDKNDFKKYGEWNEIIEDFINQERQHSFIVKKTNKIPQFLNPEFKNIGIQIPRHGLSLKLLELVNIPLIATSANISGEDVVYSIEDLLTQIKNNPIKPDLILDSGYLQKNNPSRIIEIIDNDYRIIRD